jgi:2-phospho-L-lactate guanylyltransferase
MVHALLPLKDLVSAKSRLSGVLNPSERRALAQAMVEDVLGILTSHPQISRVTLVSDDPGADLLALKYGIDFLDERTLNCRGLNPVLEKSCDRLGATADDLILILHGDIPAWWLAAIDSRKVLIYCCLMLAQGPNLTLVQAAVTNTLKAQESGEYRFPY